MAKPIVFIDSQVADYRLLANQFDADSQWGLLDADRDGAPKIQLVLTGRQEFDSIRVIAHGRQAAIRSGATGLFADSLADCKEALADVGQVLGQNGDVQLTSVTALRASDFNL